MAADVEFFVPNHLQDLESAEVMGPEAYTVEVVIDVTSVSPNDQLATLQAIFHELSRSDTAPTSIRDQEKFDTLYSFVKQLTNPGIVGKECRSFMAVELTNLLLKLTRLAARFCLVSLKRSDMTAQEQQKVLDVSRSALKMYVFLLCRLVGTVYEAGEGGEGPGLSQGAPASRGGGRKRTRRADEDASGLDVNVRENALRAMMETLSKDLRPVWKNDTMEPALSNLLLKTALHMLAQAVNTEGEENPVAEGLLALLANLSSQFTIAYLSAVQRQKILAREKERLNIRQNLPEDSMLSPNAQAQENAPRDSTGSMNSGGRLSDTNIGNAAIAAPDPKDILISPIVEQLLRIPTIPKFCGRFLRMIDSGNAAEAQDQADANQQPQGEGVAAAASADRDPTATWSHFFTRSFYDVIAVAATNDVVGDSQASKNIAALVEEEARHHVSAVVRHAHNIIPLLCCESYDVRKAAMTAIAEMLIQKYSGQGAGHGSLDPRDELLRDKYLEDLWVRMRDINPFARSHCVKIWANLCEHRAVPRYFFLGVVDEAAKRLNDRNHLVRRSTMKLLQVCMTKSGFANVLSLRQYQAKLAAYKKIVEDKFPPEQREQMLQLARNVGKPAQINAADLLDVAPSVGMPDPSSALDSGRSPHQRPPHPDLAANSNSNRCGDGDVIRLVFYEQAIQFVQRLHDAMEQIVRLLSSKTVQDTVEAIDFIISAADVRLDVSPAAVRSVLVLVFTHEPAVQQAVVDAFIGIFIQSLNSTGLSRLALNVARSQKLIQFLSEANEGEVSALERILLTIRGQTPKIILDLLDSTFGIADGTLDENASPQERRAAVRLYSLLVGCCPQDILTRRHALLQIIKENQGDNALIAFAFSSLAKESMTARFTPIEVPTAASGGAGSKDQVPPVLSLLLHHLCRPTRTLSTWMQMADAAIAAVFHLVSSPIVVYSQVVSYIAKEYLADKGPSRLAQLFFVLGATVIKQLVSIDNFERAQMKKIDDEAKQQAAQREAAAAAATGKMDVMHKELGLGGNEYKRHEILEQCAAAKARIMEDPLSIWAAYSKLLVSTCRLAYDPAHPVPLLRTNAFVTLLKLMVASESFCRANLPLIYAVLANKAEPWNNKTNIVIGLGDLLCVHPNSVQPYMKVGNNGFYGLLEDPDSRVRATTVHVCTHLVLNDMLRVQDHFHSIVRLVADPDANIQQNATMFVQHLAMKLKGNIGNLIPPLLQTLSAKMPVEKFQEALVVLLSHVEKDKPTESLVEKLCARFPRFSERRSIKTLARNIAFCLSELHYSTDRVVKKICAESIYQSYKQWLRDEVVYGFFQQIAMKAKRSGGPTAAEHRDRAAIDEWERRMLEDGCIQPSRQGSEDPDAPAGQKKAEEKDESESESEGPSSPSHFDILASNQSNVPEMSGPQPAAAAAGVPILLDEDEEELNYAVFGQAKKPTSATNRLPKDVSPTTSENSDSEGLTTARRGKPAPRGKRGAAAPLPKPKAKGKQSSTRAVVEGSSDESEVESDTTSSSAEEEVDVKPRGGRSTTKVKIEKRKASTAAQKKQKAAQESKAVHKKVAAAKAAPMKKGKGKATVKKEEVASSSSSSSSSDSSDDSSTSSSSEEEVDTKKKSKPQPKKKAPQAKGKGRR